MVTSQNLAEEIKRFILRNDLTKANGVGVEQEVSTKLALPHIITLVMSNLSELSEQVGGRDAVYAMAQEANSKAEALHVEHVKQELAVTPDRGADLMKSVLKDRYFGTINGIVTSTGIQQKTVVSLINLVMPVALGVLGKQARENNWTADTMAQALRTQFSQQEVATIPELLTPALHERWMPATAPVVAKPKSSNKWLIAALVVATAELGYIIGTKSHELNTPDTQVRPNTEAYTTLASTVGNDDGVWDPNNPAALTANGNFDRTGGGYVYGDAGVPAVLKLKGGLRQIIGSNSTENKLYQFLSDPGTEVDEVSPTRGWIGFDRIYFESNKAVLTNESMWQLSNVASILQTFPNAKVRIGGYTDSSGNPLSNLKLSRERAEAAKATLLKFGVDPSSVEAIGYGSLDNIASNDTPDGRSLNRRVSIRVMEK
ncbi:OmpA family protein [Hymenobacter tibetensis]|uniref:OmpA family protein n=1 Tax=Hymenobacter tibetensis TaxID=497967 RepID=A0ABY4D326_9BACT|nr:OmpA family protein [Hymenobacter tibetensis]UOG76437.1 OmpA family protein [Hymenobacter tibetensis]